MAIYNREDPRTALPQLEKRLDGLLDFFYPVGCYFETSDTEFNPNKAWGGKWELEAEGQVHVSSGTNYTIDGALTNETDGGASTVTLQTTQIPSHSHRITGGLFWKAYSSADRVDNSIATMTSATSGSHFYNANTDSGGTGGGQAHENMPPYIVVNRWHRIS